MKVIKVDRINKEVQVKPLFAGAVISKPLLIQASATDLRSGK